jgi:hypothetical protein
MILLLFIIGTIFLAFLSPINAGAQKGWKTFTVEDEFSFQYPSNWKVQERENRFTTIDARLNYRNNDVQMTFEGSPIALANTDDEMLQALKSYIETKDNGNVFESGIDKQMINNKTAPYVIGTFSAKSLFGLPLNAIELVTAVNLPNNELVIVQYIAKENDFDKYLPKVKQVVSSISPIDSMGNGDLLNQGTTTLDPNSAYKDKDKYCPPLSLVLCQ